MKIKITNILTLVIAIIGLSSCRYIGPFSGREESADSIVPKEKIDKGLQNVTASSRYGVEGYYYSNDEVEAYYENVQVGPSK